MNEPATDVEPCPAWLKQTTWRIEHITARKSVSVPVATIRRALDLLAGIEADFLPGPVIDTPGSETLRFVWFLGRKNLSVWVKGPQEIHIQNWTDKELVANEVRTTRLVEHVRDSISWIFPAVNAGDPHQFI